MAILVYVDNSNVWIEGMRLSAVMRREAPDVWAAARMNIFDQNWRLDFGKLLNFAEQQNGGIKRALLVGSRPPPNDSLWDAARKGGFEVEVFDRNAANREKQVDVNIAIKMVGDSYKRYEDGDQFILMAGDSDYVPAMQDLAERGICVKVIFWEHASEKLKHSCSQFISLNPHLNDLSL